MQNILVLRFSNGIFEPLWNHNYIDSIEISATETLGVENRGKYYDGAGAMRDMNPESLNAIDVVYRHGISLYIRAGTDS